MTYPATDRPGATLTNCKGVSMTIGKTYVVTHSRKGKWRAKFVACTGDFITLDDDTTSPVRFDFITSATEVSGS